jgi:hypothetical protein
MSLDHDGELSRHPGNSLYELALGRHIQTISRKE